MLLGIGLDQPGNGSTGSVARLEGTALPRVIGAVLCPLVALQVLFSKTKLYLAHKVTDLLPQNW